MKRMKQMTAVITGASGGIGEAIGRRFAEAGYNVALCYCHSRENAEKTAEELRKKGYNAEAFGADVSNEAEVTNLVERVREKYGEIDVLVNNAGVASQCLFTWCSEEEYDRVMNTNLKGTFLCSKAVLPEMIRRKSGSIINISSMWGETGGSCEVIYSASKAGIIGLTKALAKEEGPSGIRVNCIAPGVIDTAMNAVHGEEVMDVLIEETPLERLGTPDDVAGAALFLASDDAAFITGQVIHVNGGILI